MGPRIKPLDENVVHKIAAGEIVVSPANALKELIENSLDAGASNIDVVIKEGGHKLLQITDNGHGIDERDLPILAQRFTTSKINTFEDLQKVSTLGFRGEALASISHIAHLSVKTKSHDAKLATLANYEDGRLLQTKRMAGNTGTQILVEDLFYNLPQRAKALRGGGDSNEYKRVLDVVSRYAIQYPCSFSCRKWKDSQPLVIPGVNQKEKIRKVFGSNVFEELHELSLSADEDIGLLGASGWATGLNFSKRGVPFVFFINNRLVSCEPLARGIRKVYAMHMPRGDSYPFVFLSLTINSMNVDVNIHPTKREVHFLREQEIVEAVCSAIERLLTAGDQSRDFRVQSYLTATNLPTIKPSSLGSNERTSSDFVPVSHSIPRYEYKLVRTDPKQLTLSSYSHLASQPQPQSQPRTLVHEASGVSSEISDVTFVSEPDAPSLMKPLVPAATLPRDLRLASVRSLIRDQKDEASPRLLQLFSEHTFVGIVDKEHAFAAIQHDVRLYLVRYNEVIKQLIYQLGLQDLANFGTVHLGDGISISFLLEIANNQKSTRIESLISMSSMLEDYFRVVLKEKAGEWRLEQLPLIVPGYLPPASRYAQFVADLATKVNWADERECLHDVLKTIAALYAPTTETPNEQIEMLFEIAKNSLVPSQALVASVVEIANLPGLYKVFERC